MRVAPSASLLVPGLMCSARLYAAQVEALWRFGSVQVADHRHDDTLGAIARRILTDAPARFALLGLSMGGYVAFEIMRQAPDRVARLALLDTNAHADSPAQTARRNELIALAQSRQIEEVADLHFASFVHAARRDDVALREVVRSMARDTGAAAYIRQQRAIAARPDSMPLLATIRCSTLVLVGDGDELTPPARSREIAAAVAGAKLVVIPHCGHLSTLEQPQAVNAALADWMAA
ncbi:MAG: alpha/beta fold hydrolase [Proteobacteria bacterium]|nr:alpha/beta fold hydrolase [Pseudomonadota bacterium]